MSDTDQTIDREQLQRNIRTLLNRIGNYTKCPGCKAEMWWVTHKTGKKAPYSVDAVVHFKECTAPEGFGQSQQRTDAAPDQRSSNNGGTQPRSATAASSRAPRN